MNEDIVHNNGSLTKFAAVGSVVALAGLADAVYLTVSHYTAAPVPCSVIEGCEKVLSSTYAEIGGIPLAALGAAAYFTAFALAVLAAFGNRLMWKLFGVQVSVMAAVTLWLLYLQAFVIGAFCQFCLLSAVTSFLLFIIFAASIWFRRRIPAIL